VNQLSLSRFSYRWKITTSNGGADIASSYWFNFTTTPFSCSSLSCEPYGSCIESEEVEILFVFALFAL